MNTNTVQLELEEFSGLYVHDTSNFLRFESDVPCSITHDVPGTPLAANLNQTLVINNSENYEFLCTHSADYSGMLFTITYNNVVTAKLMFKQDVVYYI